MSVTSKKKNIEWKYIHDVNETKSKTMPRTAFITFLTLWPSCSKQKYYIIYTYWTELKRKYRMEHTSRVSTHIQFFYQTNHFMLGIMEQTIIVEAMNILNIRQGMRATTLKRRKKVPKILQKMTKIFGALQVQCVDVDFIFRMFQIDLSQSTTFIIQTEWV